MRLLVQGEGEQYIRRGEREIRLLVEREGQTGY